MKEAKADVLLHPVRMRIAQTLINGRQLTAQQIGDRLTDIPPATLYRHINKLLDAGIIEVVAEHQIRGAVEKVYAMPQENGSLTVEDMRNATPEEHMRYFLKFMTTVLADFERYINQEEVDPLKDAGGYRQASFYATDEEFHAFMATLQQELMKLIANEADGTRRRRTLTTIVTTEKDSAKNGRDRSD